MKIKQPKSFITEPLNLFTGGQGAGKTLYAIEQADLLAQELGVDKIYQVNIRKPDTRYLPNLPFPVTEMAFNEDGSPVLDEQGNHLPRWSMLPEGSVIIVDEAHKVFPQRGPGRPPRFVEAMAESRYEGIRWLLLSQAPESMDSFLRTRMNRHFHIERKGGSRTATIYEFENRVVGKDFMASAKKHADHKHVRRQPKKYFTWYESAKSHHFRVRLPLKVWAALAFIPVLLFVAYNVFSKVGGIMDGTVSEVGAVEQAEAGQGVRASGKDGAPVDAWDYLQRFVPVVPSMPQSAPAFQDMPVQAQPELICYGSGHDMRDGCKCFTEQFTPAEVPDNVCRRIARWGQYNPFKAPLAGRDSGGAKPEKPHDTGASGVRAAAVGAGSTGSDPASYGGFRP